MSKEAALIILQGQTMGTDYTVKYIDWADGRALPSPAAIKAQIERRLHEVAVFAGFGHQSVQSTTR